MKNALDILIGLQVSTSTEQAQKNILDVAREAGSFNMLIRAVEEAGLVDALKGRGPFTIFAPNDDAFNKIPKDHLDLLLQDKDRLKRVLKYHVASGKYTSRDLKVQDEVKTMEGSDLPVDASGDTIKVGNARVIQPDIMAINGVIHVIDTVVIPK